MNQTTVRTQGMWSSKYYGREELDAIEVHRVWRVPVTPDDAPIERFVLRLKDGTHAFAITSSSSKAAAVQLKRKVEELARVFEIPIVWV